MNWEIRMDTYTFVTHIVAQLCLTVCNPIDCTPLGSFCPWNIPGKTTGVGCHILLRGIFLTQGSYPCHLCLLHGQSLNHVQLFVTPWTAAHQASLSITNYRSMLKLMSIESVMSSNHLILCCPLLLLPSILSHHQGLFQ